MLYIHKNDEHEQPNEAVTTVDVYKKKSVQHKLQQENGWNTI